MNERDTAVCNTTVVSSGVIPQNASAWTDSSWVAPLSSHGHPPIYTRVSHRRALPVEAENRR